jgi:hypothetical protein
LVIVRKQTPTCSKKKKEKKYIYIWPQGYSEKRLLAFELSIDKMLAQEEGIAFFFRLMQSENGLISL